MLEQARRRRYIRRPDCPIVAIQLPLDTDGLSYRKWGGQQHAKPGDWLVDNDGDVYTVDAAEFARTYRPVDGSSGAYVKTTPVWAARAETAGAVTTKEGVTQYRAGDYIISNSTDGNDEYAIPAHRFERLYMPADDHSS
jgi:hypothetical protein